MHNSNKRGINKRGGWNFSKSVSVGPTFIRELRVNVGPLFIPKYSVYCRLSLKIECVTLSSNLELILGYNS